MTLIVTGSAGFIGSSFVRQRIQTSDETIISLDALTYAGHLSTLLPVLNNPNHVFVHGNICDSALITQLLATHQPRAIIHFAAESHVDRSIHNPAAFIQTNIQGTFELLEATRRYHQTLSTEAQQCFRFLHVSTDEVYGSLTANQPAFQETNPYLPNSPYAASKAASDHLVRAWHHTYQLPVLTTHCSNNYGPYHFPEKLIPLMIQNALLGKPLPVYGDGLQIRDWLFVEDHTRALFQVLESGQIGETYNIGGHSEKTNLEVVQTICQTLDKIRPKPNHSSYGEQITFVKDRLGHDRRYAINAEKIRSELNWSPQETFITGIQKTITWYLNNQDWVTQVSDETYKHWLETQYGSFKKTETF